MVRRRSLAATAAAAAGTVLALQCATPPRHAKPVLSPPRVNYELPLEEDFRVGAERPLVLSFEVPEGKALYVHFKLPAGLECHYGLSRNGEEIRAGHLTRRSTLIVLATIPAGRYNLTVSSRDRECPIRLLIETRPNDGALPPVTRPDTSSPTSPAPEAVNRCPLPPDYANAIPFGESVHSSFGTWGKSAQHWLSFSVVQRSRVYVALRVGHLHPMRVAIAGATGCTVESSANIERSGGIATTLPRGDYFIRVYTDTPRERPVFFTVSLGRRASSPAPVPSVVIPPPVVPRPTASTPPPPPLPAQLRCAELKVDEDAEWVVVVDPLRPNDPPTRLRLAVTDASGRAVAESAAPEHQPCLLTRRYRLRAGGYRACVLTVAPLDYRPEVSIKIYPAAQEAPTTRIVRDCE